MATFGAYEKEGEITMGYCQWHDVRLRYSAECSLHGPAKVFKCTNALRYPIARKIQVEAYCSRDHLGPLISRTTTTAVVSDGAHTILKAEARASVTALGVVSQ